MGLSWKLGRGVEQNWHKRDQLLRWLEAAQRQRRQTWANRLKMQRARAGGKTSRWAQIQVAALGAVPGDDNERGVTDEWGSAERPGGDVVLGVLVSSRQKPGMGKPRKRARARLCVWAADARKPLTHAPTSGS